MSNYVYNGCFYGSVLIIGRAGCRKTSFMQNLAVNIFFGRLIKVEWFSYIKLDKAKEAEMESCFDCKLEFHYPKNKETLLQEFGLCSQTSKSLIKGTSTTHLVNSVYGENRKRDCLIVADGVSGLADTSQKFATFLTVARKSKYHCVYIFHTIHPEKSIWRSILPQTNIVNIFQTSTPLTSVKKILEANCVCKITGNCL